MVQTANAAARVGRGVQEALREGRHPSSASASQPQLGVRPDADQTEGFGIGLLVDEHEVRPNVAIAEVGPRAAERMVTVAGFQRRIDGKGVHEGGEEPAP